MSADNTPLYIASFGRLYESLAPIGYALLRLTAGLMLMPHGAQKLFGMFGGFGLEKTAGWFGTLGLPASPTLVLLVGITELLGGACIAAGFLTRFWATGAAIQLAVATVSVHWAKGYFITTGANGMEFALLWLVVMLALATSGSGRFSIDRAIGREL